MMSHLNDDKYKKVCLRAGFFVKKKYAGMYFFQVLPFEGRYIFLDGHTRLYYAVMRGWGFVHITLLLRTNTLNVSIQYIC